MEQPISIDRPIKVMCLFGGMGGVGLGAQRATARYKGIQAIGEVLGSVDVDAKACEDFEMWTGVKATQMDVFDREQYIAFHGHEPPADWHEAGSEEIRAAAQGQDPDIVIITAPCKGFSGLLGKEKAQTGKYQALNKLTFRGVFLTMEAWKHNLPSFILFENVKGLASRGAKFLNEIERLLKHYGYVFHHEHYDCGELGGLAQHRKRFLLVARNPAKVPQFLYNPPKQRVRAIGEVLEELPLPIDPDNLPADIDAAGGLMHKLPRLSWKTWVRLALIPPGGDWRDLQKVQPGEYTILPVPGAAKHFRIVRTAELQGGGSPLTGPMAMEGFGDATHHMKLRVQDAGEPGGTVIGATDVQAGAQIVADPRIVHTPMGTGRGAYWVQDISDPSGTVTGDPRPGKSGGASCIADPRLAHEPRDASMRVGDMGDPSGPVIGMASVTSSNGIGAVADPRYTREPRSGVYAVQDTADPSRTVVGGKDPNGNMLSVADANMAKAKFNNMLVVTDYSDPAMAITAAAGPNQSATLVADPRMTCTPRGNTLGPLGVQDMSEPAPTVTGQGDVWTSSTAVADHRLSTDDPAHIADAQTIPGDDDRGVWFIESPHRDRKGRRVVNRPLTTLELGVLQSFPARWHGKAVVLAGHSDRLWREHIGNAMPPDAVEAVMGQMYLSVLAAQAGASVWDHWQPTGIWVVPVEDREIA